MCELCSSILKSKASLARHMKSIHGDDDNNNHKRKHQTIDCNKCGKTFALRYKKRHLESCNRHEVNQDNKFICDECEYQTKRKHHLTRHKKRKHSNNFLCDECGDASNSFGES